MPQKKSKIKLTTERISIGDFLIAKVAPSGAPGKIWIERIGGALAGEGMETDEAKLARAITKFFHKEF